MNKKEYRKMAARASNKSHICRDCLNAFWTGGLICVIGQALFDIYEKSGLDTKSASGCVSITLIFLSVLLTGLTLYQKFANIGGAGTLVPITGFANAMSSPAIEYKPEGYVLGIGANMFKIAGPVIVYGVVASVLYGIVLYCYNVVTGA